VPVTLNSADAAFNFDGDPRLNPCSAAHWLPQPSTGCTLRAAIAFCYKNVPWGKGPHPPRRCVVRLSRAFGPFVELTHGTIAYSIQSGMGNVTIDVLGDGVTVKTSHCTSALALSHLRDVRHAGVDHSLGVHLSLSNIKFTGSGAPVCDGTDKGGVRLIGFASVRVGDISFEANKGGRGGALLAANCSTVSVADCAFRNNKGVAGAGAFFQNVNTLRVTNSLFEKGQADLVGGALVVDSCGTVYLSNNTFRGNSAVSHGGALSINDVWSSLGMHNLTIAENAATYGPAVCMRHCKVSSLHASRISGNVAVSGAAIYWMRDEDSGAEKMSPPLLASDNLFADNVYGAAQADTLHASTEVVHLTASPSSHHLTDYENDDSLSMRVLLSDYYGHALPLEVAQIQLSVKSKNAVGCSYNRDRARVTGTATTSSERAEAFLDGFGVHCIPGGALNLSVTSYFSVDATLFPLYEVPTVAQQALIDSQRRSVEMLVPVSLRTCNVGEYYDFASASSRSLCRLCRQGYSLRNNSDNSVVHCDPCPAHSQECYGDRVLLDAGTWRYTRASTKVFYCPLAAGCLGGESYGQEACAEGYSGPLCATCTAQYTLNADRDACETCEVAVSRVSQQLIIPFALLAVLLIGAVVYYCHRMHHHHLMMHKVHPLKARGLSQETLDEMQTRMQAQERWFDLAMRYSPRMKIVLSTYQITALLPENLRMQRVPALIGSYLSGLLGWMSWVNFDTVRAMPISCYRSWDYIDSMMAVTSVPICITVVLTVIFRLYMRYYEYHYRPSNMYPQDNLPAFFGQLPVVGPLAEQRFDEEVRLIRQSLFSRFVFVVVICSYVAVPGVLLHVLAMFVCVDLDPHREGAEALTIAQSVEKGGVAGQEPSSRYLYVDMSVSCDSEHYRRGLQFVLAACVVYPVAFGLLYCSLYRSAHKLEQVVAGEDFLQGQVSQVSAPIRFLFSESYKPQFYMWEFVEIAKRLLLVVALAFLDSGTQLQVVWGMFFTAVLYKLQCHFQPYLHKEDNTWAEAGHLQVLCTLLCLLVYRSQALGSLETDAQLYEVVDALTALANLLFVFLLVWAVTPYMAQYLSRFVAKNCTSMHCAIGQNLGTNKDKNKDKSENKQNNKEKNTEMDKGKGKASTKSNHGLVLAAETNTEQFCAPAAGASVDSVSLGGAVSIEAAVGLVSSKPSHQAAFFVDAVLRASLQQTSASRHISDITTTVQNAAVQDMILKYQRMDQAESFVQVAIDEAARRPIFRRSRKQQKHQRLAGRRQRELAFMRSNFLTLLNTMNEPGNGLIDTLEGIEGNGIFSLSLEALNAHKRHLEDALTAAENILVHERERRAETLVQCGLPYDVLGNLGDVARIQRSDRRYFSSSKWLPPEFDLDDNRLARSWLRPPERVNYHESRDYIRADCAMLQSSVASYDVSDDDDTQYGGLARQIAYDLSESDGENEGVWVDATGKTPSETIEVDNYSLSSDSDDANEMVRPAEGTAKRT
jgi:predicted outer membrane repeat protein